MIEAGAIQSSKSHFSSNIVLVRLKGWLFTFCHCMPELSRMTLHYLASMTLNTILGAKYCLKIRLAHWLMAIREKEENKEKTAFREGNLGVYECTHISFSLADAPVSFGHLIERCMGELNLKEAVSRGSAVAHR